MFELSLLAREPYAAKSSVCVLVIFFPPALSNPQHDQEPCFCVVSKKKPHVHPTPLSVGVILFGYDFNDLSSSLLFLVFLTKVLTFCSTSKRFCSQQHTQAYLDK